MAFYYPESYHTIQTMFNLKPLLLLIFSLTIAENISQISILISLYRPSGEPRIFDVVQQMTPDCWLEASSG